MQFRKLFRRFSNIIINIFFWCCIVIIVYFVGQIFFFTSFDIPGDSMSPTLYAGDRVIVNKLIPGPRLFNLFATLREEQVDIYRASGIRKIRRNNIIVCNVTHPKDWDKIEMHILKYYIKRCIGLPGDSVEIRNGFYGIRGLDMPLGDMASQRRLFKLDRESFGDVVWNAYPSDSTFCWNIKDFGPLYLPQKGDIIAMNRKNFILYKQAIEWEQKAELKYNDKDSSVYLKNQRIEKYSFTKNYYFIGGDFTENSQDSRYWGLLPEEYIVGKAWMIWKSTDPNTGKLRWKRMFKQL